ncbi:RNA-binding protein [Burkholderia thailandensis]|nr:RNA-binding protein [Burkholderia thailandensis]AOI54170.1 RNA-binding protein [Burkholderia thailandensis]
METDGVRPHRRTPRVRRCRIRASREPRAANREPRTANREPRTANREPRTASREPRAASREPRTANREPRRCNHDAAIFQEFVDGRAKKPPPAHARRQTAHIPPSITSSAPVT